MTTALAVFVRVTKPGYEGVYEERTVWPQGRQWINIKAPGSIPVPDAAMARWDAEGFVEGYPAPVEAREARGIGYVDPLSSTILIAAAAFAGVRLGSHIWNLLLDATGNAFEAIEAAVRQRKISREEAERMKIEVRRRDAELRTKGAQFDEARDWISAKVSKLMEEGKPQKQAVAIALSMARKRFPGKIPEKEAERYDILPWLHLGSNILMIEALLTAVGSQGPLGAIVDLIKKAGSLGKGLWEAVKRGLISPEQAAEVEQKAKEKEMRTESRKRQKYVGAAFGRPRRFSEARADLEERGELRRYRSVDPLGAAVVDVLKGMEGKIATRDELVGLVSREIGASPMLVREVVRRLISEGVLWESDPGFLTIRPGLLGRIVHGIFAAEPRPFSGGIFAESRGRSPRRYAGREAEAFRVGQAFARMSSDRSGLRSMSEVDAADVLEERGFDRPSQGEVDAFLQAVQERIADLLVPA